MDNIRTNVFEENKKLREQLEYKTKQANDWQEKAELFRDTLNSELLKRDEIKIWY